VGKNLAEVDQMRRRVWDVAEVAGRGAFYRGGTGSSNWLITPPPASCPAQQAMVLDWDWDFGFWFWFWARITHVPFHSHGRRPGAKTVKEKQRRAEHTW
jgi:hypothetical protein